MDIRRAEIGMGIFLGILIVVPVVLIFLAASQPSCEDRGGTTVSDGIAMEYNAALKMMMPRTKYKCVME